MTARSIVRRGTDYNNCQAAYSYKMLTNQKLIPTQFMSRHLAKIYPQIIVYVLYCAQIIVYVLYCE